jgi:eukaryotic-like serine/threonine-protein kinase
MTQASVMPACRYRAFISYSHQDKAWADWLHRALETYRVPAHLVGRHTAAGVIPSRLNPIFRDREDFASATDLDRQVNAALAQSANLIVICSPHAAASRWVNEEVLAWKRMGRGERIFCLIVGGEPNATNLPGQAAEECFVPALRFHVDADGTLTDTPTEPIAADARPGMDGKADAKLKLIAGLLGIGFDALKQREQQRRVRRLTAIAALAVAVMLMTTALAISAVIARRDAVVAQQAAERRQKQAESLVGFMLGDLNDKLAQVSRLDIMQSVDDKAMAYFQSLPINDLTDTVLGQRAKALEKIGSVRLDQGHLPAALEAFRASARISAELARVAPADIAAQTAYARTLSFIGMTCWIRNDLDCAQQNFAASRQILLQAQARSSNNLSLKFELQNVANNIGHVLEARGQPDAAAAAYLDMLGSARELVAADPTNRIWASALGDAHNNLGKMALLHGDLALAIAEYRADDAIQTRLSAADPGNNEQRENMLRVRAILGRTLALADDIDLGMRYLQQAVDMATQLTRIDPTQTSSQYRLALYLSQLSRLKRLRGDLPAAQALTTRSARIVAGLIKQDPSNADWRQLDAQLRLEQAAALLASGQTDAARAQAQRALGTLVPRVAGQPDDQSLLLDTAVAKLLLADAGSDAPSAQRLRNEALQVTQSAKSHDSDPRLLALQVEALLGLQRSADAKPVIERLWGLGYRDPALLTALQRRHVDYPVNVAFARRIATSAPLDLTGSSTLQDPALAVDDRR